MIFYSSGAPVLKITGTGVPPKKSMEINLSPRSMIVDLFVVDTESTTGNPRHYAGTTAMPSTIPGTGS